MQTISKQKIDVKLGILHHHPKLFKPPTAVQGLYSLPANLKKEVLNTNFSQDSLQKISDHIGYFLGVLSPKVTVGIESSDDMLAVLGEMNRADKVGLYKVTGTFRREIQLTKKFRFRIEHILGILAHESAHNYLNFWGIREKEELENEILTDVAAAYLGLGALLLEGYKPISWTSDHWATGTASGYTTHTIFIGYVKPEGIRYAIAKSAEFRRLKELASVLPFSDRIMVSFHFWKIRRWEEKKKKQIEALLEKLDRAKSSYDRTLNMMQTPPTNACQEGIPIKDGRKLVEIANVLFLGQIKLAFEELSRNANKLKTSAEIDDVELAHLSAQVNELSKTISDWDRLVRKYVG
jgi:hypothetical protein